LGNVFQLASEFTGMMSPAVLSGLLLAHPTSLEALRDCPSAVKPRGHTRCETYRVAWAYCLREVEDTSQDQATDESLMAAYARGDTQAFRMLFARLAPRIHAFFRRSLGDAAAADDLLQATFLKIHASRDRYRSEFPLRVWVFSIAGRTCLTELRRRYRLPKEASEEELDSAATMSSAKCAIPIEACEELELAARVRQAVDQLPDTQRVVVHLNRFEGMTFLEIAHVLGTTEGAVKLRAFRAYETLRKLLQGALHEEVRIP
jgi:RNA polymerase sigma-70 factor (ECF subfamily)